MYRKFVQEQSCPQAGLKESDWFVGVEGGACSNNIDFQGYIPVATTLFSLLFWTAVNQWQLQI